MKSLYLFILIALSSAALANEGHGDHAASPTVTDPQIAAIVVVANQVDVDAGKFALERSKDPAVRKFAQLMVTDHGATNEAVFALAKRLNLSAEPNDISRSLEQGGVDNLAKLKTLEGKVFDDAYIAHEIDYHVAVLEAIDKVLVPNAKNEELVALIGSVRPVIAAHLEHARHLAAQRK